MNLEGLLGDEGDILIFCGCLPNDSCMQSLECPQIICWMRVYASRYV